MCVCVCLLIRRTYVAPVVRALFSKVTKLNRQISQGTASQEISFWHSLERALNNLQLQLDSPGIQITLLVLKRGSASLCVLTTAVTLPLSDLSFSSGLMRLVGEPAAAFSWWNLAGVFLVMGGFVAYSLGETKSNDDAAVVEEDDEEEGKVTEV